MRNQITITPRRLFAVFFALLVGLLPLRAQTDVLNYLYNNALTGLNAHEITLTPQNVNTATFGQLFAHPVDGQIYAQLLYKRNLSVNGAFHNVVFAATEHNSVYAFDADSAAGANANPLWQITLSTPRAGFTVTAVPTADLGSADVTPEVGITATPVIDASTNTMYVLAKTKEVEIATNKAHFIQRLHALSLTDGSEKFGGPYVIGDTVFAGGYTDTTAIKVPGTGTANVNGVLSFNALREFNRAALVLSNGVVYAAWASHGDTQPYHGWVVGFDAATLQPSPGKIFCTTPNDDEGGIWMAGGGPSLDADGNIYFSVGNGTFTIPAGGTFPSAYGDSLIKLSTNGAFKVLDFYTPYNQLALTNADLDLGSGGNTILPDLTDNAGKVHQFVTFGGKEGILYIADRDNLGKFNAAGDQIYQRLENAAGGSQIFYGSPAYYNKSIYYLRVNDKIKRMDFNPATALFGPVASATSNKIFNGRGAGVTVSANGNSNAIIWIIENSSPFNMYAYSETLGNPIYTTNIPTAFAVKFTFPVIADGKVFVPTSNSVAVYGLLNQAVQIPAAPSALTAAAISALQVNLAWTDNSNNESAFIIERQLPGQGFVQIGSTGANTTIFTDSTTTANQAIAYRIKAINSFGDSAYSNIVNVTTPGNLTEPGLVAAWKFDEGNGTTAFDATGHGHNGTLHGETAWVPGVIGSSALDFHGAGNAINNVTVTSTPDLTFTANQSFSIVAWVKAPVALNHWAGIIAKSRDISPWYGLWIDPNNHYVFRSANPATDVTGPSPTGNWQQLVAVQDGALNKRTLYVDGVAVATGVAVDGSGAGDLWFGQGNTTQEGLPGSIDDVRIYNRALTLADIQALPNAPVPPGTQPNFTTGFTGATTLTLNGGATVTGPALQLTDGGATENRTVFYSTPVNVQQFTNNFTLQLTNAQADGFAFVIQNNAANTLIPGSSGGSLGYAGMAKSIAVKFDLYGEGASSTGLYQNGAVPTLPSTDLTPSGIDLHSGNVFSVNMTYDGTVLTVKITDTVTLKTQTSTYTINIPTVVGGNTAYIGFTAGTGGLTATQKILTWSYAAGTVVTPPPPPPMQVNFPTGFTGATTMTLNNGAAIVGSALQLTDNGNTEFRTAFYNTPVNVQQFITNFTFQLTNAQADGFTFVIQGNAANIVPPNSSGPALGYTGIGKSIAIKFDLYSNFGEGINSTGLYQNGAAPTVPSTDLTPSGLDLHSGNVFSVDATYNGTVLTVTITDTVTRKAQTANYTVNIPALVGGNTAYVGFTGSTGGLNATQKILTWVYSSGSPTPPAPKANFPAGFTGATTLTLNGGSAIVGSALQITDTTTGGQNRTAYYSTPLNIQAFVTDFTFQLTNAQADGFTFVIQNNAANTLIPGSSGGSLGYTGMTKSIAVKFDLYNNNGEGVNSTGLYQNGANPITPSTDLTPSGLDLHSGNIFDVSMTYDGTILSVTITDTVTKKTQTANYTVNIPTIVGGNTAYVGFTGGTGGLTATQKILTWTF